MISRRAFAVAVASLFAIGCTSGPAAAQDWPTRPVTMVVPFPPGGGTDVLGRIIGRRLSEILGQQVIIDNVGGAGGMIGSNKVAKATPDGYEFVLGSRADAINQTLYKHPLYDLKEDLVPVILVADQPMAMIARHDLPVDGLQDFIAYVKKNQATMRTGSAGIGSTGYVDCALFNQAIGVKVQDIPYRGGGPALQDLIGGQYDYFMTLSPTAVPPIQSNLVKGIAVFRRERLPSLPSLPTAYEQGMKDFEASTWFALLFSQGHAGRDHQEAARRHRRGDGYAGGAGARWSPPAPSSCRPSIARPHICKASSVPRSRKTARRSGPPACRSSEGASSVSRLRKAVALPAPPPARHGRRE